jgi:hypothetical protein
MLVHYCTNEVKLGRTDLARIVGPGMAPDESLAPVIVSKIEGHPLLSARKAGHSIGLA